MRACLVLLLTVASGTGCLESTQGSSARFELSVAPLTLPGVSKACYDLRVTNAADGGGSVVWAEGNPAVDGPTDTGSICSTQYGSGSGGGITYVGSCDATPANAGDTGRTNSVTIWVDSLYDSSNAVIAQNGSDAWQDPCPTGCVLNATCLENADTKVEFNLTILRQANQGFFDIGVNFEDIFCSAKVDCKNSAGDPLKLLFKPSSGLRDTTIVSAFACTAGAGAGTDTILYRDPLKITCGATVTEIWPDTGRGNAWSTAAADPAPADAIWQYAVYADDEALTCGGQPCNKRFWNVAFGLDATVDNCKLTTSMAASAGDLVAYKTPFATTYPYIAVSLDLTDTVGLVCNKHPLNGDNTISTKYTPISAPEIFDTDFDGAGFTRRVPVCSPVCQNGGVCGFDGLCACPTGYSGPTCGNSADSDAQAFITAAGLTDSTQITAVVSLVQSLKTTSVWSKLKAIYPMVGGTATSHKFNLKDPRDDNAAFRLQFSGTWVHSATGAKPDGATAYARTYLNPTTMLATNGGSLGYYSRTNENTWSAEIGAITTNPNPERYFQIHALLSANGPNYFYGLPNSAAPSGSYIGNSDSRGFYQASRLSSSSCRMQKNKALYSSFSASYVTPNLEVYLGARNQNGSVAWFSGKECAFAYMGETLTATDMDNIYDAVQAFQTSLGRQMAP